LSDDRPDREDPRRWRALAAIAGGQLLVLTLWFSASAVAPQLEDVWGLSTGQTAGLTLAVQIGFVAGALGLAATGIPDAVPSRRLFVVSALVGAGVNGLFVLLDSGQYSLAFGLRLLTGVALAGVYPSGLKAMAGWFRRGRGLALGVLVGALTVGSAGPHLIRGIGFQWRGVVLGATVLAVVGAGVMAGVADGPYETGKQQFDWRHVGRVVRNRGVRLSTYGYLGHMWELYAMWTWTAAFLSASALAYGIGDEWVPMATFLVIAVGGAGAWLFGAIADRAGRTVAAGASLAISGACALATPLLFGASPLVVVPVFMVWGFTVVADSAQFSTMVVETAEDRYRGTALTLQTALGFLLTLVTIRGVPALADAWGWQWAFPVLAVGPALGILAMIRLRRSPARTELAGGLG
jgi:MFS family permease